MGETRVLVSMVSVKGAPGVTTLALGLAARWPQPGTVVVEADPAGGDLSARFGISHDPGLAAMALAARHTGRVPEPAAWSQRLPCGVEVVLAAPGAAASASLAALATRGGDLLRALAGDRTVVVDAGRWQPDSPATPLVAASDLVLLVARPRLDGVRQCQARAGALAAHCRDSRLVLVGEPKPWPASEIAAVVGVPLVGVVPVDRRGAGVLGGELVPDRGWDRDGWRSWTRLPLLRACHSLARHLASRASSPPTGIVSSAAGRVPRGPAGQGARPVPPVVQPAGVTR
jgi:hypothetical protein